MARGVGVGVEPGHILAAFVGHRAWRGALADLVESVATAHDLVLPTEGREVVLEAFLQGVAANRLQGGDLEIDRLRRSRMKGGHIECGVKRLSVGQGHGQLGLGDQIHSAVVRHLNLGHRRALLIERHRQAAGAVKLIGIGLIAGVVDTEAQEGRLSEIDRGVGGELLHIEVILLGLFNHHVIDREIPRHVGGDAVEAHIESARVGGLEHCRGVFKLLVGDLELRHHRDRHRGGIGISAGFDFEVEMVNVPGGVPERDAVVAARRHVDFLVDPHVGVIAGIHIPVAGMGFPPAGDVIVGDGDTGFPSAVVADPSHGGLIHSVSCFKSLIHKNLSECASHQKQRHHKGKQSLHTNLFCC